MANEVHLDDEITRISEQLTNIATLDIPSISEFIFANVFIPLFAGDETNMYNATFETWINATGNPYQSVNVVDDKGNVVLTVPPLYDRNTIKSSTNTRVPITSVITTANQYSRIHPNQGKAYLTNELNKRAMVLKVPTSMLSNLETWNKIFARYNRPAIMAIEEKIETPISKTSEDDFEEL